MLEIVFSDSAAGSLKLAKGHGKLAAGGATAVFCPGPDGAKVPQEELEAAARREEERLHRAWEQAVPLGGSPADVFVLPLALDVGDIAGGEAKRLPVLRLLYGCFPEEDAAQALFDTALKSLHTIRTRMAEGEAARIWYGDEPGERCGLCWFLAQAAQWGIADGLYAIRLPAWSDEGRTALEHKSCGEIEPHEWHRYLSLQRELRAAVLSAAAGRWRELQAENAPLRAVINGGIQSVAESFYDPFIERELAALPDEFNEALLIGRVLGRYRLGIGDGWAALRIEKMIESGRLSVLTSAPADGPSYHRILKKR